MANEDHLRLLRQGVDTWNAWREKEPSVRPDLIRADLHWANLSGANLDRANLTRASLRRASLIGASLRGASLSRANLSKANLGGADLLGANLFEADLREANLFKANLCEANFRRADLTRADFSGASFSGANLSGASLSRANLSGANLSQASLSGARLLKTNLSGANLSGAGLFESNFSEANLSGANLSKANLLAADLSGADLRGADLSGANLVEVMLTAAHLNDAHLLDANLIRATLVETDLTDADITGCKIYGVSAWKVKFSQNTKQQNLVITSPGEPEVTIDNIEVAQFVYLLLHNEQIRDAIDTIGKKGVLLLGRFTGGRITVLERLREELRKRNFVPIVFNFDKPETKTFTETVRLLAGLSRFVIVDITNPRSAPLELQATVPECMVPFCPILDRSEELKPFAMLTDLQINHPDRVLDVIRYSSVDRLVEVLDAEIITPAQKIFADLLERKAQQVRIKDV
jgi:uncharacterized protein YjbI with pentapeptide repeats